MILRLMLHVLDAVMIRIIRTFLNRSYFCGIAGQNADGQDVFLRDIWPSRAELQEVEKKNVIPSMFQDVYGKIEVTTSLMRLIISTIHGIQVE